MSKKIIAHFTDAHLGQKLVMGRGIEKDKMLYEHEPAEHQDNLRLVLDDIARKGISDIVFGGDIGSAESVPGFFEILKGYRFTPSLVLGNHDAYANVIKHCYYSANALTGKMCYSHDDGFLRSLFLDTSDNTVSDHQLTWLRHQTDGATKIALFLHHPILEIVTPLERAGATLRDRDKLKTLLTGLSCEVWAFCGHYHMDDGAAEANIRQFATPAVSYQIVKRAEGVEVETSRVGYRILEIDEDEIRTEVVMLDRFASQRTT
jgi:3',5'-cyclic-AMP phosphodiesterase